MIDSYIAAENLLTEWFNTLPKNEKYKFLREKFMVLTLQRKANLYPHLDDWYKAQALKWTYWYRCAKSGKGVPLTKKYRSSWSKLVYFANRRLSK